MPPSWDAAMGAALDEARAALATGDVPIGAVVLSPSGAVLAAGRNVREAAADPTGHAEVRPTASSKSSPKPSRRATSESISSG